MNIKYVLSLAEDAKLISADEDQSYVANFKAKLKAKRTDLSAFRCVSEKQKSYFAFALEEVISALNHIDRVYPISTKEKPTPNMDSVTLASIASYLKHMRERPATSWTIERVEPSSDDLVIDHYTHDMYVPKYAMSILMPTFKPKTKII